MKTYRIFSCKIELPRFVLTENKRVQNQAKCAQNLTKNNNKIKQKN